MRISDYIDEKELPYCYDAVIWKEDEEYVAKIRMEGIISRKNSADLINEVINIVGKKGGGIIFIDRGEYKDSVRKIIYLKYSNISLIGSGIDQTKIHHTIWLGTDIQGSESPLTKNVKVMNLTIDGTYWEPNASAVGYRNVEDAYLIRVKIYNCPFWNIFGAFEQGVPKSKSLYIIDCILDRAFEDRSQQDMTAFNNVSYLHIENTVFMRNKYGSTLLPYSNVDEIFIKDVTIRDCTTWNIVIGFGDPKGSIKKCYIDGLYLINCSSDGFIIPSELLIANRIILINSLDVFVGSQFAIVNDVIGDDNSYHIKPVPIGHNGTSVVAGKVYLTNVDIHSVEIGIDNYMTWPDTGCEVHLRDVTAREYIGMPVNPNISRNITLNIYMKNVKTSTLAFDYFEPSTTYVTYVGTLDKVKASELRLAQNMNIEFIDCEFNTVKRSTTFIDNIKVRQAPKYLPNCSNLPTSGLYKGDSYICYDSTTSKWVLKIWDGSTWQTIG